jgi:predicted dehydrogenase
MDSPQFWRSLLWLFLFSSFGEIEHTMKTYNFGIIGAGVIADFHARAVQDIPNARLVGICDHVLDRAAALAEKYSCKAYSSLEELLNMPELDVVTIATPSGAHMEPALAAAGHGIHVICEKPLEINLERIDKMMDAHRQAGTQLGGIFQNRFNDAILPLRQAIQSGRFGRITYAGVYVPWWRSDEYYHNSWHGSWNLDGGGALMNQSIHMIDMLCDLIGPVESVQAQMHHLGHPNIEAEDTAAAVLKFTNGALGIIYGTTASYPGQSRRFEITGTKGTVIYVEDSLAVWQFAEETPQDTEIRQKFGQTTNAGAVSDPAAISHTNHMRNFQAFLHALETNTDFEINGVEARKSVELILAIYQSARQQKMIKLKL